MRVLLDTNIVIHRETAKVVLPSIGQLFRWLDHLIYTKCIHPLTAAEIAKHHDTQVVRTMQVKLEAYHLLKTEAPRHTSIEAIIASMDKDDNDRNDSRLLNELVQDRVDLFITEDRKLHRKAKSLGLGDKVFTVSHFVEKCMAEHPELVNYKVLSVQKTYFGSLDVSLPFFDSFREDYQGFDKWFHRKSDEIAYVCYRKNQLVGFLYIKTEGAGENYRDIQLLFTPKKRLKIGTLKVELSGYRIGERFLKIVFDNALVNKVEEIYVTIFDKSPEQVRLIELLEEWGFVLHGEKATPTGNEKVYVRDFSRSANLIAPRLTFPFVSKKATPFFVPIWPAYHTELLPDSILNTESPANFKENEPHRNTLSKVYISHSYERNLKPGDAILFYRTGGKHAGVATTIGIVEKVYNNIQSPKELHDICRKKTFFTDDALMEFWTRYKGIKPFVVEFLYAYSLRKRPNLARLVELGIIKDIMSVPRGFSAISMDQLQLVLKDSQSNESLIVD
ncbi:MAG TPA: PIN domain-containing protein [Flavisolibacter sp.]|jgi:predicted nucleic acid-binding protein|nr:PIN domain-containing protein [Flavisolibacter sp.]